MLAIDLIRLMDPDVKPNNSKVHLASWNGTEEPLAVYLAGQFDEWQSWQSQNNFTRKHVISLVKLPERNRWLYVGTYVVGAKKRHPKKEGFVYDMAAIPACSELEARLVIEFERSGRAAYLLGDSCLDRMHVHEIRAQKMAFETFPGFKKIDLSWRDLETIARHRPTSWQTALSNVSGVYLISDPDKAGGGKLYVGSATGEGGIWRRWCQYVDGHGKNIELKKLIDAMGRTRAEQFRFSILEIADLHASPQEVLERESHWKRILLSRSHGYNAN